MSDRSFRLPHLILKLGTFELSKFLSGTNTVAFGDKDASDASGYLGGDLGILIGWGGNVAADRKILDETAALYFRHGDVGNSIRSGLSFVVGLFLATTGGECDK